MRKFLKGMGATAIAPVAIKASALIPKPDIATAIQKSYQSLTPLIQNFRASTMNFDSNVTTYFNQFNKAKAVGTSYADIVPATDKEGNPLDKPSDDLDGYVKELMGYVFDDKMIDELLNTKSNSGKMANDIVVTRLKEMGVRIH